MQSVDETLAIIRSRARKLGTARVAVSATHGFILAEDVLMGSDSPPFDRALLDGFAVRSTDAKASAQLHIVGRQDAGGPIWEGQLGAGECLAINTGAPLPNGADAVLMVEHSMFGVPPLGGVGGVGGGGDAVHVMKDVPAGFGIQRRAAQAQVGSVAVAAGSKLHAATLAAAVLAGAAELTVYRKPRVALLTTGDELVPPGSPLAPGQIPNSNTPMLLALIREASCEPLDLGTCGDQPDALRIHLQQGLQNADVLIITGGMSMGTKDLVPPLLKDLGVHFHVEKVRMKPGKPFLFGTLFHNDHPKYIAGLPGNPVSAFVTFHLFVHELLALLSGAQPHNRFLTAQAAAPFSPNADREFFQPCLLKHHGPTLLAEPLPWTGSADLLTLSRAGENLALARRPINTPQLNPGEPLGVLPLHASS